MHDRRFFLTKHGLGPTLSTKCNVLTFPLETLRSVLRATLNSPYFRGLASESEQETRLLLSKVTAGIQASPYAKGPWAR